MVVVSKIEDLLRSALVGYLTMHVSEGVWGGEAPELLRALYIFETGCEDFDPTGHKVLLEVKKQGDVGRISTLVSSDLTRTRNFVDVAVCLWFKGYDEIMYRAVKDLVSLSSAGKFINDNFEEFKKTKIYTNKGNNYSVRPIILLRSSGGTLYEIGYMCRLRTEVYYSFLTRMGTLRMAYEDYFDARGGCVLALSREDLERLKLERFILREWKWRVVDDTVVLPLFVKGNKLSAVFIRGGRHLEYHLDYMGYLTRIIDEYSTKTAYDIFQHLLGLIIDELKHGRGERIMEERIKRFIESDIYIDSTVLNKF